MHRALEPPGSTLAPSCKCDSGRSLLSGFTVYVLVLSFGVLVMFFEL